MSLTINKYQYRLEKMASTDKLTGISSRQVFDILRTATVAVFYRLLLADSGVAETVT